MGRWTHKKVRDGSGDPRGGPELVGGLSRSSGTGRGTLGDVWCGLWTLREVRYGLGDPPGGLGWVGRNSRR